MDSERIRDQMFIPVVWILRYPLVILFSEIAYGHHYFAQVSADGVLPTLILLAHLVLLPNYRCHLE